MTHVADLIRAIAALLWPLFAFYVLYRFGPDLKSLAARLKKGKLLGQEIELGESLDRLDRTASEVASEVAAVPQLTSGPPADEHDEGEVVQRVLAAAAHSPKAALLLLASEIEKQLRQLLASLGLLKGRKTLPLHRAFAELDEWGGLPRHVAASLKLFWDVRNRLVHGHTASDDDILRAIDSGVTILRALQAIPHEVNTVYHPGVTVYTDAECRNPVEDARGVILETVSPGGVTKTRRIFPTTRTHFKKGVRVAWEWSDGRCFGQSWYHDPDTGQIRDEKSEKRGRGSLNSFILTPVTAAGNLMPMPRGPRLDAPGVLHHVMVRGIERRAIFRDDRDRQDFVQRLGVLAAHGAWQVYAWTLLPNHLHLLVRRGRRPLGRTMGALLAGYAGAFNRRHQRTGHLFQNRYKSIVVEEAPYLLELTRYIHLNPLRAKLVRDLAALDRYPWCGHRTLLGRRPQPWQTVDAVLGQFARQVGEARRRYRQFVAEGVAHGRRAALQGGGLRRSAGGWEGLAVLRRGRERWTFDERVLGSGPFVDRLLAELPAAGPVSPARAWRAFPRVLARLAPLFGVAATEVTAGSRRRPVAAARAAIGVVAVRGLGLPVTRVAGALGVTPMPLLRGFQRGRMLLHARKLDVEELAREAQKG